MQNWERSEFDEQWKDAFEHGEVSPSALVWANLDRELTLLESNDDKKRIVFYQRLAAACVLFALTAGWFGFYHWRNGENQMADIKPAQANHVQKTEQANGVNVSKTPQSNDLANKLSAKNKSFAESKSTNGNKVEATSSKTGQTVVIQDLFSPNENQAIVASTESDRSDNDRTWLAANVDLPSPGLLPEAKVHGEPRYVEIVRKLPYISPAFMADNKKDKFNHEKLWASVSAASGSYSEAAFGSYSSATVARAAFAGNLSSNFQSPGPSATSSSIGKSYSYGVIGGVRVADRWVVQTGLQYLNQSISSSASYSSTIVSTNEFVSVPMQAGYLLINRKIGWQLNPGVATDFFVKNTVSNQQQSFSQGSGTDSPYRSVNFAGLVSSELSYKLGKNYRLSVVPGMRYSFNPVLKSQTTGNALLWDVGFRFRYIFK